MATIITKCLILIIISFAMSPQILLVNGAHQQVPCFFIFGDSQFDNGNNNNLITESKANYRPHRIDFPGAVPTGRFTNGFIVPDFLAKSLGFPDLIPPFVTTRGSAVLKGLNYASGASGILDASGMQQGQRFTMNKQLVNHYATVGQIAGLLGNRSAADKYLRQCLYAVNIGLNDYVNNYYQRPPSPSSLLTPDAFANLLIRTFSQQLRTLYNLGSRKVAVFGLGFIGCIPQQLALNPNRNGSACVDSVNNAVKLFNNKLVPLIKDLNKNLPNARFTYINVTSISLGDPSLAGVKVVNAACCELETGSGKCAVNGAVCSNRDEYLFFDNFIQTQISMKATASRAYKALLPADVFPVDIQRLVQQ